jgi:hypothetical protein
MGLSASARLRGLIIWRSTMAAAHPTCRERASDPPARTRTGGFPIGVRRGRSPWQHDDIVGWLAWVRASRFAFVDLGDDGATAIEPVHEAGLSIGTVDLPMWRELLSTDDARRRDAVSEVASYLERCAAAAGVRRFLACMRPEDPSRPADFAESTAGEQCGILNPLTFLENS